MHIIRYLTWPPNSSLTSISSLRSLSSSGASFRSGPKPDWWRLCEDFGVDGDGVLGVHPAWNTVQELSEFAETFAFSSGEAAVWVSDRDEEAGMVTAEDIHQGLKEAVEDRVGWWL